MTSKKLTVHALSDLKHLAIMLCFKIFESVEHFMDMGDN